MVCPCPNPCTCVKGSRALDVPMGARAAVSYRVRRAEATPVELFHHMIGGYDSPTFRALVYATHTQARVLTALLDADASPEMVTETANLVERMLDVLAAEAQKLDLDTSPPATEKNR